jgi:Glycosyl transferase family 2
MNPHFPTIEPVQNNPHRPFWSVMIPTYNSDEKYLKEVLESVLQQDPGADVMQIEVVDDCSTAGDIEALVQEIGRGRISFYRQPKNLGLLANWDVCIQRSQGHWVHLLHQDDFILPGFYERLRQGIEQEPLVGAALCRNVYVDEDSNWQSLSNLEQKLPGVLTDWVQRISVTQLVQFPAIVVKRSTYEKLGGFCPQARSAADWEMWRRIAVYYPIWYEPQLLACFRLHSNSTSSGLIQRGENIADTRLSIGVAQTYLPPAIAQKVSQAAKKKYAFQALGTARQMLSENQLDGAINQWRESFRCSVAPNVLKSSIFVGLLIASKWIPAKLQNRLV